MKKRVGKKSRSSSKHISKSRVNEVKDKRGKEMNAFIWILIFIGIIFFIYFLFVWNSSKIDVKDLFSTDVKTIPEIVDVKSNGNLAYVQIANVAKWVVGPVSLTVINLSGSEISALIITFAIWLMILLMFGDILSTLSFFSNGISWTIAVLMTIVLANLKFAVLIAAGMTAIFGTFGVIAAYLGLFASFIAFLAVDWGVKSMMPWVMRRKGAQIALKSKKTTEEIKAAIGHYKDIGRTLSE